MLNAYLNTTILHHSDVILSSFYNVMLFFNTFFYKQTHQLYP